MKKLLVLLSILTIISSCEQGGSSLLVSDEKQLNEAISNAQPGTEIVMKDGVWSDIEIRFAGEGKEGQPITLRAETPGNVIIDGESDLKLAGEYLVVDGLYFKGGASPSGSVIQFSFNNDQIANHSRVTNCVIEDFNKSQRNKQDFWVLFKGRHNQLDHCYLAGKSNKGPTIRINLEGNQSIKNFHKINNNHFGPRPPKGGPSAETIQLGTSHTSMSPSNTQVYENLFDRCNGEVEVISSKANFNEFRNNVFYKSEGSLVTRHGNYCTVDGNYFIGDENSPHVGGVRLIGTGHWVTNNYFYNLRGEIFRGPLAVMNGIKRSPLNRYIQVTDVVVAHNTWVNCVSPWQFGVGSNIDQKDVLPPSEIRSETPIRTLVANNLIYNKVGDKEPILRYDSIDEIDFKSNVINNQGTDFRGVQGLTVRDFSMSELEENIWVPSGLTGVEVHEGFDFDQINTDVLGNSRVDGNLVGATNGLSSNKPNIMDLSKYGPGWFDAQAKDTETATHSVGDAEAFAKAFEEAKDGDVIELTSDFEINQSIKIDRRLTVKSAGEKMSTISYVGQDSSPAFEMNPKGELMLDGISLKGNGKNHAFASLAENMSSLYNLTVINSEISNFDYVLKAYKYSFSQYIKFESSSIRNCNNGIELSSEDDDKGDYNAENVLIVDTKFDGVKKNVVDYYRGGYDESTVGGNLIIQGCTFTNSGAEEPNGILINTYGIINVDLSENTFVNNRVKLVARLWGAKNNSHSGNEIKNSGKLTVEQNLALKLVY